MYMGQYPCYTFIIPLAVTCIQIITHAIHFTHNLLIREKHSCTKITLSSNTMTIILQRRVSHNNSQSKFRNYVPKSVHPDTDLTESKCHTGLWMILFTRPFAAFEILCYTFYSLESIADPLRTSCEG